MQLNALNKNQIDLNRTANLNNSEIVDIDNNANSNTTLSTLKLASIDKNLNFLTFSTKDKVLFKFSKKISISFLFSVLSETYTLDIIVINCL